MLSKDSRNHVSILGEFNVRNREWPVHFSDTSIMGREIEQLAVANNLPKLIDLPTRKHDWTGNRAHALDLT